MKDSQKRILRAMAGERQPAFKAGVLVFDDGSALEGVTVGALGQLVAEGMVTAVGAKDRWALTERGEQYAELLG